MNVLKYLAMIVALLVPLETRANHAVCPGQEVTVFFVNGVYAEQNVKDHARNLGTLSASKGVSLDCVHFAPLLNHNEVLKLDLLEATAQKTRELGIDFLHGSGMLLRAIVPDTWFLDGVIDAAYSRNAIGQVVDADLDEHMKAYRDALALGQRIILTCHSQGCLYTQQAYFRMTEDERAQARFVTVVTPAAEVPEGGPNTTLYEDALAGLFFVDAILPNIGNTEKCVGDVTDRWTCHGMETSYLHGTHSREEIVGNIIAALPQEASGGTVSGVVTVDTGGGATSVSGAFLSICTLQEGQFGKFCDVTLASTTSVSSGGYQFTNLPPCDPCRIWAAASVGGSAYVGQADFSLPANGTATVGVLLGPLIFN